jgi:hypothetical protein
MVFVSVQVKRKTSSPKEFQDLTNLFPGCHLSFIFRIKPYQSNFPVQYFGKEFPVLLILTVFEN